MFGVTEMFHIPEELHVMLYNPTSALSEEFLSEARVSKYVFHQKSR